jgi:hypothetical protein
MSEEKKTKFNTTICTLFQDDRFGEGSFISPASDDITMTAVTDFKKGDKLLLKMSNRTTKEGKRFGYLEVLKAKQSDI